MRQLSDLGRRHCQAWAAVDGNRSRLVEHDIELARLHRVDDYLRVRRDDELPAVAATRAVVRVVESLYGYAGTRRAIRNLVRNAPEE